MIIVEMSSNHYTRFEKVEDNNMNNTTAIELGARCKRFRNAHGLSQQALGDMVGMTGAAISKYEKEGLYNIEVIQALSKALEHDLLQDEIDADGDAGIVGKHILEILADHNGYMKKSELAGRYDMYGMTEDRIIKELFKLEKYGMCVREQYNDFYGEEQDVIFITAKGLIVIKKLVDEKCSFIYTYEKLCNGNLTYQDYIDNHNLEKRIRNLNPTTGFRANFIQYLRRNYTTDFERKNDISESIVYGEACYSDIYWSVICETKRSEIDLLMECMLRPKRQEYDWMAEDIRIKLDGNDRVESDFLYSVNDHAEKFDCIEYDEERRKSRYKDSGINEIEQFSKIEEWEKKENIIFDIYYLRDRDNAYKQKIRGFEKNNILDQMTDNPMNWYSEDDIKDYIKQNILPAVTEDEKRIESELIQIMKDYPEVCAYFKFSNEWEQNGIADMLREIYKVPHNN